jgi:uncharacterized membrane protein
MNDPGRSGITQVIDNYRALIDRLRGWVMARLASPRLPMILISCAAAYYIIYFSLISILYHMNFGTGAHDVGVYDQVIWMLSRFRSPYTTIGGVNLFSFHASFYCLLLAPLFWIYPSINLLFVVQSIFLGAAVFPIFLFARKRLDSPWLALLIGLLFLLFPALQNMNLENFHPEVMALFFLAWALYFMLIEDYRAFYLFSFFSMLGKEEISLTVLFMGLYLLLIKKEKRAGIVAVGMGLLWYLFVSRLLMPMANNIGPLSAGQPLFALVRRFYAEPAEPALLLGKHR